MLIYKWWEHISGWTGLNGMELGISRCFKVHILMIREGLKKKREKVWSFAKPGGGSPGVVKKPNCFFETEFFSESI